jgi:hypothetical protein
MTDFGKHTAAASDTFLGLIVADMTNPPSFDVIRGAEATAARHGYTLVLAESAERAPAELTAARRIISRVDGLILASPRMHDTDIQALAQDRAVVVINREVNDVPRVVPDVNKGIGEAIRSLVANGQQKVAFVAGPTESWMSIQRWEGIQLACERSGLEAVRLSSSKPTVDGGRRVAPDFRAYAPSPAPAGTRPAPSTPGSSVPATPDTVPPAGNDRSGSSPDTRTTGSHPDPTQAARPAEPPQPTGPTQPRPAQTPATAMCKRPEQAPTGPTGPDPGQDR